MCLSLPYGCCVLRLLLLRPVFFTRAMTCKKSKKRNRGRRRHRRSQEATARRRLQGTERLRWALRGLLARRPVRRVLLGTAAKIFFQDRRARGPRAGGAAGRRAGHCAAPAQEARPGFPPRGHPQRQAARLAPPVLPQVASEVPAGHRLLDVE